VIVLDLGCGDGFTPQKLSLPSDWQIIGLDVNRSAVAKAHINFPDRVFICSAGEQLPFGACIFDRVICNVALPYMNIPKALNEIYRVLVPGGVLLASLHTPSFTFAELRNVRLRPKAALYRLWVLANGVAFHFLGRNFGEAFQTERGIRIALDRANFAAVAFRSDSKRWFVEATRPSIPGHSA
jgi:SAM-dependent methyltransferase